MEPLTIVVSFDVGEQVVSGGIPGWLRLGEQVAPIERQSQPRNLVIRWMWVR
jgi:hypothetical protein